MKQSEHNRCLQEAFERVLRADNAWHLALVQHYGTSNVFEIRRDYRGTATQALWALRQALRKAKAECRIIAAAEGGKRADSELGYGL